MPTTTAAVHPGCTVHTAAEHAVLAEGVRRLDTAADHTTNPAVRAQLHDMRRVFCDVEYGPETPEIAVLAALLGINHEDGA